MMTLAAVLLKLVIDGGKLAIWSFGALHLFSSFVNRFFNPLQAIYIEWSTPAWEYSH